MHAPDPADTRIAPPGRLAAGRRDLRAGAILAAAAAALASAGLAYWVGVAKDTTLGAAEFVNPPAPAPAYAPARADAADVVRAYEQLQDVYSEAGTVGLARFARACADALAAHPETLDFCLSFRILSASMRPDGTAGEAQDIALVRAALPPGADARARLGQIHALAREASLQDIGRVTHAARAVAPVAPAPAAPAAHTASRPARPIRAASDRPRSARTAVAAAAKAAAACRRRAPAAPRTVCASPGLRRADLRLRAAYQHAASAGVGVRRLDRDQRRFRAAVLAAPDRAAVARLYARRTRVLEVQARRARD